MRLKILIIMLLTAHLSFAQRADVESYRQLYVHDMNLNKTGMTILGSWAVANVVGGVTGLAVSTDKEAKAFWGMNAIWGAVNTGFAVMGYWGANREKKMQYSCDQLVEKHEFYKNLFLLNAGLDVAYIGTGLVLNSYANDFNNPAMIHGFGKSIAMQGIALILFDGTMYTLHKKQDKKWYKLLQGICVTGNGIGFRYALN